MSFLSKLVPRLRPLPEGLSPLNPHVLVATWFGTGLIKPAPGTMGTIAAVPPGLLIMENFGAWGLLGAASILMVIGTISAVNFPSAMALSALFWDAAANSSCIWRVI